MRTNNTLKNSMTAILSNVLIMLIGFILQKIFINILGEDYLGINGLFNNIVSMLAIVELGIGPAIVSNLYKPLANNDEEKIKSLLNYYKRSYTIIGFLVFGIGLLIMPFLHLIVNTNITFTNYGGLYTIFLLFIIDASISYFYSYKRSIIQADQKNRIINITHLVCYSIMAFIQGILLIFTHNFILYLIIKVIFRFVENLVLSLIVNKMYPYLKDNSKKIDEYEKKNIFKKVKGLIYHKISGYIVLGTDNIIISKYLGTALVGIYSNYYLIISALSSLISQVFGSITASVGNLLILKDKDKSYDIYKKLMFINFWIYGFSSIALFVVFKPFITLWIGEKYLLSTDIVLVLCVNFYMLGMRSSIGTFKEAAGIFYEDRFIPVLESMINLISSLILVKYIGMLGVFVGTFLSSLIVVFYSLPHFVFEKIFNRRKHDYYILYFKYVFATAFGLLITFMLYSFIINRFTLTVIIKFILSVFISLLVPNVLFVFIFRRSEEYMYFKNLLIDKIRRK